MFTILLVWMECYYDKEFDGPYWITAIIDFILVVSLIVG